jgi:hypothetical protein
VSAIPLKDYSVPGHPRIIFARVDKRDVGALSSRSWRLRHDGYAIARVSREGRTTDLPMHRFLLGLERGDPREGDHRNGNRIDNRRRNLRIVTRGQNAQNCARHRRWKNPDSGYRGVSWAPARGKWVASAYYEGRLHHLGLYVDPVEAGAVAAAARAAHMPFATGRQ